MFKFALASMKYHKRATLIYIVFLTVSSCFLLLLDSLQESLPVLVKQTQDLLDTSGYQEEKQVIFQQLQTSSQRLLLYYDQLRMLLLLVFSVLFFFLLLIYQRKKAEEFAVWYQSGSSFWSWVFLNLGECLIPLLLVTSVFSFLFLLCQYSLGKLVLLTHLEFMDHLNGASLSLHISDNQTLNQLFIRFPTTNDALVASIQLTSKQWLSIFFTTLLKTMRTLLLVISAIGFTTLISYSYWRYRHWNNSSH